MDGINDLLSDPASLFFILVLAIGTDWSVITRASSIRYSLRGTMACGTTNTAILYQPPSHQINKFDIAIMEYILPPFRKQNIIHIRIRDWFVTQVLQKHVVGWIHRGMHRSRIPVDSIPQNDSSTIVVIGLSDATLPMTAELLIMNSQTRVQTFRAGFINRFPWFDPYHVLLRFQLTSWRYW